MNRDEFIRTTAELIAGLAVPVSLPMPLGKAAPAWGRLHSNLVGVGWAGADIYEAAIREILDQVDNWESLKRWLIEAQEEAFPYTITQVLEKVQELEETGGERGVRASVRDGGPEPETQVPGP